MSLCIFYTLHVTPLLSQVSEKKLHQVNDPLGEISNGKVKVDKVPGGKQGAAANGSWTNTGLLIAVILKASCTQ